MSTNKKIAYVCFTELSQMRSMPYEPSIEFTSLRGLKVSLKNCINRNINNLRMLFGFCKSYEVKVYMGGKVIAKTTLSA